MWRMKQNEAMTYMKNTSHTVSDPHYIGEKPNTSVILVMFLKVAAILLLLGFTNPDILARLAQRLDHRPRLVIGFAAETERLIDNAKAKRLKKGCDWIVANDVSSGTNVFGGDANIVHVIDARDVESWPKLGKDEVARRLAERIARRLR